MTHLVQVRGTGPDLLLLPGLPGRHEWLAPVIGPLSTQFRVLTLSLTDTPVEGFFDRIVPRIDTALAAAGASQVIVAGLSFGGLVAAVYAGQRPHATSHLVVASAPSPRVPLDPQSLGYLRRPTLSLPLFAARGVRRLGSELLVSLPTWQSRTSFALRYGAIAMTRPGSPRQMAAWIKAWTSTDLASIVGRVLAPTLVITGEATLDRVVPVASSLDYLDLIQGATHYELSGTGHLGILVRPHVFTEVVRGFTSPTMDAPSGAPLGNHSALATMPTCP